jgi:uncharacterized protein YjbJ (UPF0337 family)
MSDSWRTKIGDLKARLGEAATGAEGDIDVGAFMTRVRETVGKTASEVDADAIVTHLKGAIGEVEGKVDAGKVRDLIAGLDAEKLSGMLDEARTRAEPATRLIAAQGERLVEHAPGMVDKLVGVAKEKFGELTGDEELAHTGELDQLRGQIKEKFADAGETAHGGESTRDGEKGRR